MERTPSQRSRIARDYHLAEQSILDELQIELADVPFNCAWNEGLFVGNVMDNMSTRLGKNPRKEGLRSLYCQVPPPATEHFTLAVQFQFQEKVWWVILEIREHGVC